MGWEVQKACLIPVNVGAGWRGDSPETTEGWQTVATVGDEDAAEKKLQEFLSWNKGRGFFYRIVHARRPQKA